MVENLNEQDIIKYWRFLRHKNQTEIRAIKPRWFKGERFPKSIFINNETQLIEEIKKLNGDYNIYIGINERKENGTEDLDVEYITNIGHDIDAHGKGLEGVNKAGLIAFKLKEDCLDLGYKEPLILNSGNGFWVIHHIHPIPNTEENCKKIKEFGLRIKKKYDEEPIEFDTSVYNPSRISRVAGTLNISEENSFKLSSIMNEPSMEDDLKLSDDILAIELPKYQINPNATKTNSICSFMDYCLTHEVPKGERHKTISRNMAIYISDHPDRELLKEQYYKIQKGSSGELDNYLKGIDENGKDTFPFSIGELVNFTKKYKIPFDWRTTPEYKQWMQLKKAENKLQEELKKEETAKSLNKLITSFYDKRDLANQFLKIQPLFYDKNKNWWIWNNTNFCWELSDETDIINFVNKYSLVDTINSKERNEILETLRQESRNKKPKDIKSTWIQFKNKIIDIESQEEFEATPEYFVTNPIPWEIHPFSIEETPTMDKIFNEWVGQEYTKTLYEILAYSLLPDYPINRIFCFVGSGMNGKSCFLRLLKTFIGESNCCSTELDTLLSSRFEVTRLYKKLLCQMGETNFEEMSKTSLLKKLTGGDLIGFEHKGKNPFESNNYAKILISTNNLPSTTDKTIGFYRRWLIIDFPNEFNEKKDILNDIPEEEYQSLALKCSKILKEIIQIRTFTNEGSIEERMERYESKSNFLDKFLKLFIDKENFEGFITKSEFYKKFISWSKEQRHRELSEVAISKLMKERNIESGTKYFDWAFNGKGGNVRVWYGISWKN
jgi:P4 family phage/plasmid primase-like protien